MNNTILGYLHEPEISWTHTLIMSITKRRRFPWNWYSPPSIDQNNYSSDLLHVLCGNVQRTYQNSNVLRPHFQITQCNRRLEFIVIYNFSRLTWSSRYEWRVYANPKYIAGLLSNAYFHLEAVMIFRLSWRNKSDIWKNTPC